MSAYSFEVHASTAADLKQVSDVSGYHQHPSPHISSCHSLVVILSGPDHADNQDDIIQRLRRAGGANYDRSKFD
jgi:hypothetical protein